VTEDGRRRWQDPGWLLVAALSLMPLPFWFTAIPLSERFQDSASTLHSLANIAALVGTAGFAVNLLLGARLRVVERLFGGLHRLYSAQLDVPSEQIHYEDFGFMQPQGRFGRKS
jgi:hypothetical protein